MKVEAYTKLGEAFTLCGNKENTADCLLLFNDRESELNCIIIHICKHDLLELSKTIEKWLNVNQEKKTP
jgi:hypothetical protein